jgi:hypothetical protein
LLTIRSSRPRVVASAMCFTLRLHMSATPTQGGLTQALGGNKHSLQLHWLTCSTAPLIAAPLLPSATALNVSSCQALLRKVCRARLHITCVSLAGFGNGVCCRSACPLLIPSFLTSPAESSRVRVRTFPLRFSASAPGLNLYGRPPPPNNSFKPPPCRGVGHVRCATLARVRRPATGRLNSGVRAQ